MLFLVVSLMMPPSSVSKSPGDVFKYCPGKPLAGAVKKTNTNFRGLEWDYYIISGRELIIPVPRQSIYVSPSLLPAPHRYPFLCSIRCMLSPPLPQGPNQTMMVFGWLLLLLGMNITLRIGKYKCFCKIQSVASSRYFSFVFAI